MIRKSFRPSELKKSDIQYTIKNDTTLIFSEGDEVFLPTNPDKKLIVSNVDTEFVFCNVDGKPIGFLPQTLIHYKYIGLLTYKNYINYSLN